MEAEIQEELLSFLTVHNLADTVSNIDDIVLSYLVGVVELVGQGDDGLDIVELMEMMNAYLPGFDQINRSETVDWMFELANKLINSNKRNQDTSLNENISSLAEQKSGRLSEFNYKQNIDILEKKFPSYDYSVKPEDQNSLKAACCSGSNGLIENHISHSSANEVPDNNCGKNSSSLLCMSTCSKQLPPCPDTENETQKKSSLSKRKGRQLSCSSQDSQDDLSKTDSVCIEEAQVRMLLEMFPSACTMEARHCLHLSAGNIDRAAQLIIDRHEIGQSINSQAKSKTSKSSHKVKKVMECQLEDNIKSCVLQKYSFIDTEEDKKTFHPPPLKGEAKKLVRYREGQVVSMKGERFSEVKKRDNNDEMKATYVSLKPARKYRFH